MEKRNLLLLIEDDLSIREVLQTTLEMEGYKVVTSSNGKKGLELLSQQLDPNVILLDLMMPEMNGKEFLEEFNRNPSWNQIKVIIISAFTEQAKELKADGFIRKPIDFNALLFTIEAFCQEDKST